MSELTIKEKLHGAFDAGRGHTPEDRKVLATEHGVNGQTVGYYWGTWTREKSLAAAAEKTALEIATEKVDAGAADLGAQGAQGVTNGAAVSEETVEVLAPVAAAVAVPVGAANQDATVPAVGALPEAEAPRLPTVGEIVEGQVHSVTPDYALVELIGFTCPGSNDRPLRGKLDRGEVMRRGQLRDVRDRLLAGDMVNVYVLDVQPPDKPGLRWRVALSSKRAPVHQRERVPLEQERMEEPVVRPVLKIEQPPIVTRGAEVAAQLTDLPVPSVVPKVSNSANPAPGAKAAADAQAAVVAFENFVEKQLLVAAEAEVERLRAELEAAQAREEELRGQLPTATCGDGTGLCASCVHGIDQMCPYADTLEASYTLSGEELHERHRGARIIFGRRPTVECSLYRKALEVS